MKLFHEALHLLCVYQTLSQLLPPPQISFDITELKKPSDLDRKDVDIVISSEHNETLKYIVKQNLLYCPQNSLCSFSRSFFNMVFTSCCEKCRCEEQCHAMGTCCHDAKGPDPDRRIVMPEERLRCVNTQMFEFKTSGIDHDNQYWMVAKCSLISDTDIVTKCENTDIKSKDLAMDELLPVTINETTYKNKYCALCNNADYTAAQQWIAQVQCPPKETISGTSVKNLIQNLQASKICNMFFYPTEMISYSVRKKCNVGLIGTCNVTGQWDIYDAFIEKACLSYTQVYRKLYRNVFCFMCNQNQSTDMYMQCQTNDFISPQGSIMGSFTAIVEYNPGENGKGTSINEDSRCLTNERYDTYQKKCLEMHCSSRKAYTNGECRGAFAPKAFLYNIGTELVCKRIDCNFTMDLVVNGSLNSAIKHALNGTGETEVCGIDFWKRTVSNNSTMNWVIEIHVRGTDKTEFINSLLSVENKVLKSENVEFTLELMKSMPDLSKNFQHVQSYVDKCFFSPRLKLSRLLVCPYILVHRNKTNLSQTGELCLLEKPSKCFKQLDFEFESTKNIYKICADKYFIKEPVETPKNNIETILSFSCSLLSMCSLLFTVITYSCFPSLRTLPGFNTMGLSISLLISHGLYSFGMYQTHLSSLCVGIGILTHFFWLNSIMWMNVCCVHMFRVLGYTLHTANKFKTFTFYTLYTFITSGVIVGAHILFNHFTRSQLGYGGRICYINDPKMILYFFAIPLGIVIMTNFVLFITVVVRMARLPDLSKVMNKQRDTMTIYAKLTTLTGITWVFAFVYQHVNVMELSYVYIVLNGCQGLYIMVAFVLNKRVLQLYGGSTCCKARFLAFPMLSARSSSQGTQRTNCTK